MSGLQVHQANYSGIIGNFNAVPSSSTDPQPVNHTTSLGTYTAGDPQNISYVFAGITDGDDKRYLRMFKDEYLFYNQGNTPFYIRVIRFKVKKDIPGTSFASITALLQTDAPTLGTGTPSVTTSAAAQRYLKFYGNKVYKMTCGSCLRLTVKKKFRSPRCVRFNYEGNLGFLGTRITRGFIMQYLPMPVAIFSGLTPSATYRGYQAGYHGVSWQMNSYQSWYDTAATDPNSVFVEASPLPSGSPAWATAPIPTDQYMHHGHGPASGFEVS